MSYRARRWKAGKCRDYFSSARLLTLPAIWVATTSSGHGPQAPQPDEPCERETLLDGSDGIVRRRAANGDPAQLGELLQTCVATEPAVAAVLHAAEWHLRLVVNRGAINVANSEFEFLGNTESVVHVASEDGAR